MKSYMPQIPSSPPTPAVRPAYASPAEREQYRKASYQALRPKMEKHDDARRQSDLSARLHRVG